MSARWTTPPVTALRAATLGPLADVDAAATPGFSGKKKAGLSALARRGDRLAELQELLYANGRAGDHRSVLLVLQGMDTAGKGGIARHVGGVMDPQGLTISGFGKPTEEELAHDFLWRIRKRLPAPGRVAIFDRSHYEDVLAVRVHELVPQAEWEPRYDIINDFERDLVAAGTTVVKCVLAVSKTQQRRRLARRLTDPTKYWKYNPGDIDERAYWDSYGTAYQAVLDRTDSAFAPWYVIPADRKWFARLAVCELLVAALEGFDLGWPPADFDLATEQRRVAALTD